MCCIRLLFHRLRNTPTRKEDRSLACDDLACVDLFFIDDVSSVTGETFNTRVLVDDGSEPILAFFVIN